MVLFDGDIVHLPHKPFNWVIRRLPNEVGEACLFDGVDHTEWLPRGTGDGAVSRRGQKLFAGEIRAISHGRTGDTGKRTHREAGGRL